MPAQMDSYIIHAFIYYMPSNPQIRCFAADMYGSRPDCPVLDIRPPCEWKPGSLHIFPDSCIMAWANTSDTARPCTLRSFVPARLQSGLIMLGAVQEI